MKTHREIHFLSVRFWLGNFLYETEQKLQNFINT